MKLLKRASSLVLSATLLITSAPTIVRASEKPEDVYPYMIYIFRLFRCSDNCWRSRNKQCGTKDQTACSFK
ncbi:MAG: hypothetical protein K6F17_04415, partial [Lachnospiraceae bacterium]|nr:hypothetical protein [Lachnospiraceae bacterium]